MKPNRFRSRMIFLAIAIQFLPLMGYGAAGDTWARRANMPTSRMGLSTCTVNGKIYAIGGYPAGLGAAMTTVEAYDPATDSWTVKSAMPNARVYFASAVVNGKIYAMGGDRNALVNSIRNADEYDPVTDTWTRKTDMPTARYGLTGAAVDGKIYVVGGYTTFGGAPLSVLEVYDPGTDTWETKAAMPTPRGLLCASAVNGKIFAIGSARPPSGPWLATVEMYDPLSDTWTSRANLPVAKGVSAASTVNGRIYVIGGRSGNTGFATVEEYDPVIDTWTARANMSGQRFSLGTSEVNGQIYAIGGASAIPNDVGLSLVEEYTPPDINTGPPVIYSQPRNRTALPGTSVTFQVGTIGEQPMHYQWLLNGMAVNNATNAALTLSDLTSEDEGNYSVLVRNSVEVVTSGIARLLVADRPIILADPVSRTIIETNNVGFGVSAMGVAPLQYQWRFNGTNIDGATTTNLSLTNVQTNQAGDYTVMVTNAYGAITSAVAVLTVLVKAQIVQPPQNQTVLEGGTATFFVAASGSPPLSFRWSRNGVPFTNAIIVNTATTSSLTLTNVSLTNQGAAFRTVVTNLAGSAPASLNGRLTVLADFDRDGMADEWEARYALDTNTVVDAALDGDADGLSNRDEYLAGTDPRNAASVLKLQMAHVGDATALSFLAITNRTYTVEWNTQVIGGIWTRLQDLLPQPANRIESVPDTNASGSMRLYRVVTPRRP